MILQIGEQWRRSENETVDENAHLGWELEDWEKGLIDLGNGHGFGDHNEYDCLSVGWR